VLSDFSAAVWGDRVIQGNQVADQGVIEFSLEGRGRPLGREGFPINLTYLGDILN
jgi:hypothetical protein